MASFLIRRLLATIPVVIVVTIIVFLLMHAGGGDPAAMLAGEAASAADVARVRSQLGFDRPLPEQFLIWLGNMLRGDFGLSVFSGQPVAKLILQRLEPTVMLALFTILFAVAVAVPLGVAAAAAAGTWLDRVVMGLAVLAFSFPVFFIGYLLVYGLSLQLGWFPVQGYRRLSDGLGPFLQHITLPTLALGCGYVALIARVTRATMIQVLREDYIRTARAKGLSRYAVVVGHALKNAAVPIATVVGIGFALLISGVVVTESVFAIPGLGRLTADAILHRDFPVIQAVVLLFSLTYVAINLAVDLLYTVFDPRIGL